MVNTDYQFWGMHFIWWFIWFMFIFWIFALPFRIPGQRYLKETPLDKLKMRYAAGEINTEEYQEKKRILEEGLPIQDRL
jgi:putative membrane protein